MDTTYTTDEAKFHGFMLGIDIARALIDRSETVDIEAAITLMGGIADGVETLVDPEKSYEGCNPATAKVLRDGTISAIEVQKRHAQEARSGLNKILDSTGNA